MINVVFANRSLPILVLTALMFLGGRLATAQSVPFAADAVLVLDAQSGVSTLGTDVTGWEDLSGNGRHGTTITPVAPQLVAGGYNGHDVLRFNGEEALLLDGQVLTSQEFTIFALASDEATFGLREIFSNWDPTNSVTSVFFGTAGVLSNSPSAIRRVRMTDRLNVSDKLVNPASISLLSGVYVGDGDGETFQNGTSLHDTIVSADRGLETPYYIGVQGSLNAEYWIGTIAQVIVYNRALDADERAEVASYINQHWAPVGGGLSADFNVDGAVDGEDLAIWKQSFGVDAGADANGDGVSDGTDFLAWQQQLGSVPVVANSFAVPEPASGCLAAAATLAMIALRRTRGKR